MGGGEDRCFYRRVGVYCLEERWRPLDFGDFYVLFPGKTGNGFTRHFEETKKRNGFWAFPISVFSSNELYTFFQKMLCICHIIITIIIWIGLDLLVEYLIIFRCASRFTCVTYVFHKLSSLLLNASSLLLNMDYGF